MAEKISMWNSASKAGLVLGGVSVAYMLLTMLTGSIGSGNVGVGVAMAVVNVILWCVKFGACIYLLRFFLKKFSDENHAADNSTVFRYGMCVALLSALVYSAFYFAYVLFIAPDTFETAMEAFKDNPMMDSASMDAINEIMPMMPTISFFTNLIYCWLFGTVLSAIFSRNIPSRNPFSGNDSKIDEQ